MNFILESDEFLVNEAGKRKLRYPFFEKKWENLGKCGQKL